MKLGELHEDLRRQLSEAGIEDADTSARWIAAHASGNDPDAITLRPQLPLTNRMMAHADAMAARRLAGEPLQYVLGRWGFRTLDLATDARALIPRPETELTAGIAIDWLNERSLGGTAAARRPGSDSGGRAMSLVADLGTGSGAIALVIAAEVPAARVFATDSSAESLALARLNLAGAGSAAAAVTLHQGDWFGALEMLTEDGERLRGRLDVIVSNPPYVPAGDTLGPEVADWEPHEALFAGPTGLEAIKAIVAQARSWLAPGGLLVVEIGSTQGQAVRELAAARGYSNVRVAQDLAGLDRVLVAQRPDDDPDEAELGAAIQRLHEGGFVVMPTDTICGVMARYADSDAVRSVCDAKQRPHSEPMPILVSGLDQADELVELTPAARELARRHWPGGLTLVARRRGGPDPLHGRDTLGVRAPALGWLRWVIDEVGPVTGTSANRHGHPTPADARQAATALSGSPQPDANVIDASVIDGSVISGTALGGTASTVVDVTGDEPVILREGAVPAASLTLQ